MKRESNVMRVDENLLLSIGSTLEDTSVYKRELSTHGTVTEVEGEGIHIAQGSWISFTMDGIGTEDFDIDADFKITSHTGSPWETLLSMGGSNTLFGVLNILSKSGMYAGWYANGMRIRNNTIYALDSWNHYEFQRRGTTMTLIDANGVIGTCQYNVIDWDNTSGGGRTWYIGANQSLTSENMNGYVKNITIRRITK